MSAVPVRTARCGLCVVLSIILAAPATVSGAPDPEVVVLVQRAQLEIAAAHEPGATDGARRYAVAAEMYGRAADRKPEFQDTRVDRDVLLGKAVSAYREASRLSGDAVEPLRQALALVDLHLEALDRVYGRSAAKLPEHANARRLRAELVALPGVVVEAPVEAPEPEPTPTRTPTPVEEEQPIRGPVETVDVTPSPSTRPWKIGLGVSLGLTGVSLGAALGTALAVMREPFQGPLYRDVYAAAVRSGESLSGDMCDGSGGELRDACAARDHAARAAVAMTVLTGVFVASSIAFGVMLARAKRGDAANRRAALGFGPAPGGGFVVVGGRF